MRGTEKDNHKQAGSRPSFGALTSIASHEQREDAGKWNGKHRRREQAQLCGSGVAVVHDYSILNDPPG
jgi:hypothetical protein